MENNQKYSDELYDLYPAYVRDGFYQEQARSQFFNKYTVSYISKDVTKKIFQEIHKRITVPDEQILDTMWSVFDQYDYVSPKEQIDMTVSLIVRIIADEEEMITKNNNLNIEVIKYLPDTGMQQINGIKLNNKGVTKMLFNYNY